MVQQERTGVLQAQGLELGSAVVQAKPSGASRGELRIERLLIGVDLVERAGSLALEHGISFVPDPAPGLVMLGEQRAQLYRQFYLPSLQLPAPEPGTYQASGSAIFETRPLPNAARTPVPLSVTGDYRASKRVMVPVALGGTVAGPEAAHFKSLSATWGSSFPPPEIRIGRLGHAENPEARGAFHAAWQEMFREEGPFAVGELQVVAFVPNEASAPTGR